MSRPDLSATVEKPLALACLVYAGGALALFPASYVSLGAQYAATQFITLPAMLVLGLAVAALVTWPSRPSAFLAALWRRRGRGAIATVAIFCLGITAFSTYKHHLPPLAGFYADAPLAAWDAALHAGDPWRWAHALAPDGAAGVLFWLYGPVWFAQWFGFLLVAALLPRDRLRVRYLLAFAMSLLLLGSLASIAGASAGPIFFDRMSGGTRFAELARTLGADRYGSAMLAASDYLYASYASASSAFGGGISAMPSMHVAAAALNALFLGSFDRRLGLLGWCYAAAILLGSIYFGWHYALDGYVSVLAVLAIWRAAGVVVARQAQDRPIVTSSPV